MTEKPPHELGFEAGMADEPLTNCPFEPGTSAHYDWCSFHARGHYIATTLGIGYVAVRIAGELQRIKRSEIKPWTTIPLRPHSSLCVCLPRSRWSGALSSGTC